MVYRTSFACLRLLYYFLRSISCVSWAEYRRAKKKHLFFHKPTWMVLCKRYLWIEKLRSVVYRYPIVILRDHRLQGTCNMHSPNVCWSKNLPPWTDSNMCNVEYIWNDKCNKGCESQFVSMCQRLCQISRKIYWSRLNWSIEFCNRKSVIIWNSDKKVFVLFIFFKQTFIAYMVFYKN